MSEKQKNRRGLWLGLWCLVLVLVIVFNCWATTYAISWDSVLTGYFGIIEDRQPESGETQEKPQRFADLDALRAAEREAELEIVDEGVVLLKNDNQALPLAKGNKVSVFGQTAQMWMTKEKLSNTKDTVFLESLESAGLVINGSLRKMYKQSKHTKWGNGANLGNGGIAGTWAVDEVPVSEYKDSVKESFAEYNDAAIVVLTRGGSEGGDLPRYMGRYEGSDEDDYLSLSPEEKDLLAMVGASFERVIVVLHTTNAMAMDFTQAAEYGVDAVLWVSGTGEDGVQEIGRILVGDVNPSGKNIDTYVYDNFSAPAMQNFGDFRFTSGGKLIDATTTTVGGTYSYQHYAEGIYVGYKYYETRYEDKVLGAANVGEYDYAATVAYPFGWGLSYTTFDWSGFQASGPDKDGLFTLSVTVTNSGSAAGKDVVQLYYQAPYTDYDRENGVEKAAVNLLDFGKTKLLQPGESETMTITARLDDMKSYDSKGQKTYILEAGDYYLTLARDAHEAVNNMLAAKGFTPANGMTAEGDASRVLRHTQGELKLLDKAATGADITNQFDDCVLEDAVYLSRSNWSAMENDGLRYTDGTVEGVSETMDGAKFAWTHEASPSIVEALTSEGWDIAGNPLGMDDPAWPAVKYGQSGSLKLEDLVGKPLTDPDWERLISQLTQAEQLEIVGKAMYVTPAIDKIGKPVANSLDGPQGMIDYVSGGAGYQFTDENLLGATWNKELVAKMADLTSTEFTMKGVTAWWAPAVNIHRAAFSGRNFEYYSEDGTFTGIMAAVAVKAAKANGVNCQVKHFFLNDQEFNRGANGRLAPFCGEQAIREIYMKPFEMAIVDGGAAGVMLSMARIGTRIAPGSYAVCTGILRNEWGMTGAIITDAQSLTPREAEQALAAGCDLVCTTRMTEYLDSTLASRGGQYTLQNAVKHTLHMQANSASFDVKVATGFPIYKLLLIAYNVLTFIYMAWATLEIVHKLYPEKKLLSKKGFRILRIVLGTLGILILGVLLYMFFTQWLPVLQFALQTAV